MIKTTDDHGTFVTHEPEIVLLLMRLYEPTFEWESTHDPAPDVCDDTCRHEQHVQSQIADLVRRRGHELTPEDIRLLERCGAIEMQHAALLHQARSFGLHVEPSTHRGSEHRVRWRKKTWTKRSGTHVTYFEDFADAVKQVRKLKDDGDLEFVTVDERPVGMWRALDRLVDYSIEDENEGR